VPPLTPGQQAFHAGLTANLAAFSPQAALTLHARAFIADAERTENSMGTRINAAISACAALDLRALENDAIHKYLHLKYAATDEDLTFYYDTALCLAKTLLSKLEKK
jgi:hypothetical protein